MERRYYDQPIYNCYPLSPNKARFCASVKGSMTQRGKKTGNSPCTHSDLDMQLDSSAKKERISSREKENEKDKREVVGQNRGRWHSFERKPNETRWNGATLICEVNATQMTNLKRTALFRITTNMSGYFEKFPSSSRRFPKLFRRLFSIDTKKNSVKPSLAGNLQRYGQALPPFFMRLIEYVKTNGREVIGVFRKSGKKTNILDLEKKFNLEDEQCDLTKYSIYDIADFIKSYFRKLVSPVVPNHVASLLLSLNNTPPEKQLHLCQTAMIILPDENREALYILLDCLYVISVSSHFNMMTAENLSICLIPALIQIGSSTSHTYNEHSGDGCNISRFSCYASGLGSEPASVAANVDLSSVGSVYSLAQRSFSFLINHWSRIFLVPQDLFSISKMARIQLSIPMRLSELGTSEQNAPGNYETYMNVNIEEFYEEHRSKYKNWTSFSTVNGIQISSRKVKDGFPLRLYRGYIDFDAPPSEVFLCYLYKGSLWRGNTERFVIKALTSRSDLFYQRSSVYSINFFDRDFTLLRKWQKINETFVLAATSVKVDEQDLSNGSLHNNQVQKVLAKKGTHRGIVMGSRVVIEPYQGKCRVNMILRIDLKGRRASNYKHLTPYIISRELLSIREYFSPLNQTDEAIV